MPSALSRLLAALLASVSSTPDTCASADGLLAAALAAMVDRASTTATAAGPDTLMGADATADSTSSAAVWLCTDRVALDALTTANTRLAAVLAAAPDRLVPLAPPSDVVLFTSPARTLVCAAASAAPVAPASCAVTEATAAVMLALSAVRFRGGEGGSTTAVTAKVPTTVMCAPLTPDAVRSELKSLAKATGSIAATPEVSDVACEALAATTAKGTASVDVASMARREVAALNVRPDMLTLTELTGSCR